MGTFLRAADLDTETFREFTEYVQRNLDPSKLKKVVMFCTGGIRCEKATAYMKQQGFDEVYHLQGGILKYLEEVPKEQSLWRGGGFVVDNRVAVNRGLGQGSSAQCPGCRHPRREGGQGSPQFLNTVSGPR